MPKKKVFKRRLLSILLCVVMTVTTVAGVLPAYADEVPVADSTTIIDTTPVEPDELLVDLGTIQEEGSSSTQGDSTDSVTPETTENPETVVEDSTSADSTPADTSTDNTAEGAGSTSEPESASEPETTPEQTVPTVEEVQAMIDALPSQEDIYYGDDAFKAATNEQVSAIDTATEEISDADKNLLNWDAYYNALLVLLGLWQPEIEEPIETNDLFDLSVTVDSTVIDGAAIVPGKAGETFEVFPEITIKDLSQIATYSVSFTDMDGNTIPLTEKFRAPLNGSLEFITTGCGFSYAIVANGDFKIIVTMTVGEKTATSTVNVKLSGTTKPITANMPDESDIIRDGMQKGPPGAYLFPVHSSSGTNGYAWCGDKNLGYSANDDSVGYIHTGTISNTYVSQALGWFAAGHKNASEAQAYGIVQAIIWWATGTHYGSVNDAIKAGIALFGGADMSDDAVGMLRTIIETASPRTAHVYSNGHAADQPMVTYINENSHGGGGGDAGGNEEPEYAFASGVAVATGTQTIVVNKFGDITLERLAGAIFGIAVGNADTGSVTLTTGANGQGSASWTITDTAQGPDVEYCSNYDRINSAGKAEVAARGACTSEEEAIAASKALAQDEANSKLQRHTATWTMTEKTLYGFNFIDGYWKTNGSMTGPGASTTKTLYNEAWKTPLTLFKADGVTGDQVVADTTFDIYEWNKAANAYQLSANYQIVRQPDGNYIPVVVNQAYADAIGLYDGTIDWTQGYLFYTQANTGKYYITERVAPVNYVRDAKAYYITITEDNKATVVTNAQPDEYVTNDDTKFVNHRQYGDLTLYKYDDEAEANYNNGDRITQGDIKDVDGAVYALIAAEDIVINDVTLYTKGQIVQTATVGKSYVTDALGYILDTNGNRIVDTTAGVAVNATLTNAATTETPGVTRFAQIEIGKYVVVEMQAAFGYLADETVWRDYDTIDTTNVFDPANDLQEYNVTVTYNADGANNATLDVATGNVTDNTVHVVLRDEVASEDDNNLTMDDGKTDDHGVYSGDFVQKQGSAFVKLDDQDVDTEGHPEQGAGFKVYLISEISKVADGTITPQNGESWTQADIAVNFYDYNFNDETTAHLYKRQSETWTDGDTAWLIKADAGAALEGTHATILPGVDGYTDTLYYVGEMISAEDGYFETPELPYGQYVLVQTTWVEDHKTVQPVLITVNKDSSVLQPTRYLDNETTETFLRLEKTDSDAVTTEENHDQTHAQSHRAETVLKAGATYRIKLLSDIRLFDSDTWKVDPATQELTYYDVTTQSFRGTVANPFAVQTIMGEDNTIVDAYVELAYMLPVGTYELIEQTAPSGFVVNGSEQTMTDASAADDNEYEITDTPAARLVFNIDNDSVYPNGQMGDEDLNDQKDIMTDQFGRLITTIYQENKEQKGTIEIYKFGEQLATAEATGATLAEKLADDEDFRSVSQTPAWLTHDTVFSFELAPVRGAVFEIYAAEDIYTQQLDKDAIAAGLYSATELANDLVHHKDDLIATITTDGTGYAYADDLRIGSYYIKEVTAGEGFVLNDEIKTFEISAAKQTENFIYYGTSYKNERQKVEVTATKRDADTDEPVAGAVFGLYNKNDIISYIYENALTVDELNANPNIPWSVADGTDKYLDINGEIIAKGTIVASYNDVFAEIQPTDGNYAQILIDSFGAMWHLGAVDDEGTLLAPADTLLATAVTGEDGVAEFDIDLPLDEYYIVELEAPERYSTTTAFTGKDEISNRIDFTATYDSDFGGQTVETQIHNEETDDLVFTNQLTKTVFTKSDIVSGVLLDNAKIQILEVAVDENGDMVKNDDGTYKTTLVEEWISDRDEVNYFYTDNRGMQIDIDSPDDAPDGVEVQTVKGHLIEGLKEGRQYIFREIQAPAGYVGYDWSDDTTKDANKVDNTVAEEIRFTIQDGNIVADHDMKDQRTVGNISITKEGEVLVSTEVSIWDTIKNFITTIFNYVLGRVQGAEFEVYVKEDIYTPDHHDTDADRTLATYVNSDGDTVTLTKDTLVDTIVTGITGIATIEKLPLGSYYLKEVGAGDGDFVINTEVKDASLIWPDQETPIVISDTTKYKNERQTLNLTVTKLVTHDDEYKFVNQGQTVPAGNADIPVEGAVFGLYNKEAIYGYEVNAVTGVVIANPNAMLPADTLIEQFVSGADGKATLTADVPCGLYYVKELTPPSGYHTSDEVIDVDASYRGEDGTDGEYETVLTAEYDFYNQPTFVKITKSDITTGEKVIGATLTITDEDGNVVEEWVTGNTDHYVEHLEIGKKYTLTETKPGPGYVTAESIEFTILDMDEDGVVVEKQDVEMKDDYTKLVIRKESIVDGSPVVGAQLTITDKVTGNIVAQWITDETGEHEIDYLPIGKYTLTETITPDDFSTATAIDFEIGDTGVVQRVTMIDDVRALTVKKVEPGKTAPIAGATMQILDMDGNIIKEFVTTNKLTYIQDMVPGDYVLVEKVAPNGYLLSGVETKFTVHELKERIDLVYVNDYTKVVITKDDITNGKPVPGATLTVKDDKGNTIDTWVTDSTGSHEIDRLKPGTYTLTEVTAPNGYEVAETITFVVAATGEIQKVVMHDKPKPTTGLFYLSIDGGKTWSNGWGNVNTSGNGEAGLSTSAQASQSNDMYLFIIALVTLVVCGTGLVINHNKKKQILDTPKVSTNAKEDK